MKIARAIAWTLCTSVFFVAAVRSFADTAPLPFLDPMFTDNMVLQRDMSDPVWGWTSPNRTVTVTVAGKSASAVSSPDGKWTADLPKLPVGGPYTMTVVGPDSVTLKNVLVGDVWLCSGQSNMQFGVGNLINAKQEIADANYPDIRLYVVDNQIGIEPQKTVAGNWETCTPDNLGGDGGWGGFSAVAYFFGRDLYQNLHVPIGLIHSSWGGTPAEAWTSEPALRARMPDFDTALDNLDSFRSLTPEGVAKMRAAAVAKWYVKNDAGSANTLGWSDPNMDDSSWGTMNLPCYFQQGGDPSLVGVSGVVWFRRTFDIPESDSGKALTLKLLVDDNDTTWVNGVLVGATEGYTTPRAYAIPASILKSTGNTIAVRVLDTGGGGGIYGDPSGLAIQADGGDTIPLAGPWRYKLGANLTNAAAFPAPISDNPLYPSVLYNAMIAPLIPYSIKGAIWYQGESNAGKAYQYRTLLPTMITDWRKHWNEKNFPFLIVQLAAFGDPPAQPGDDVWAELQEAQWLTAKNVPNTGIVTAIDIGDASNIHPKDKQDVGLRLSLVARKLGYDQNVEDYGPVFSSIAISGQNATIQFAHVGGGMVTKDGAAPTGFAICGADHKWYWGTARIDGSSVVVSSPQVPSPIAVRYAWAGGPISNMMSKDGLPMFPFRTDNFRLLSQPSAL